MFIIKILITGGCKNGKSFYAQELIYKLSNPQNRYYIATMKPCDNEDLARIKRHISEREGYDYQTIEQPFSINKALDFLDENSCVLLDSTTALLANEMFLSDGSVCFDAYKRVADELLELCKKVKHIAFVSDYIYSDAGIYDEFTEGYRFGLAYIDKALAHECDTVCEVTFGHQIFHKGEITL